MITYFIRLLLLLFCLYAAASLNAQSVPSVRWEPGFAFSKKIDSRWSYNLSTLMRQRFTNFGEGESNFSTDRWDVRAFGTYTLLGGVKLTTGYMYRQFNLSREKNDIEHRITQQIAFISNVGGIRFGNKIRLEQRIRTTTYINRLRYKFSTDFPFNGERLDPGEFYLITGNELIYAFNSARDELENRFSIGFGKLINKGNKLEFSITSQFSDLISSDRDHILQIGTIYFFSK